MRNMILGPLVRYLGSPHDSAASVRHRMIDQKAEGIWNMAFKFAFIRNPYTWVESMRRHAIAQEDHPLHQKAQGPIEDWPEVLYVACRDQIETTDGKLMFQRDMVLDLRGKSLLDRLCRFENYADEVKYITELLGIQQQEIPHVGLTDVPTAEIGGEYRAMIATYFYHDFIALNYEQ